MKTIDTRKKLIYKQLSDMGVSYNGTYPIDQVPKILLDIQSLLCSLVFQQDHAEAMRATDVIMHVKNKAHQLGCLDNHKIQEFLKLTYEFNILTAKTIAGRTGEEAIRKAEKYLNNPFVSLYNLRLEDNDTFAEYDGIIINKSGKVYILESKNNKFDSIIDESGILMIENKKKSIGSRKNVIEQLSRQRLLLEKVLKDAGLDDRTEVVPLLVWTNPYSCFKNYSNVDVVSAAQLPYVLNDERENDSYFGIEEMEYIKARLMALDVKNEVPLGFEPFQFFTCLLEVLEILEDDIENQAEEELMVSVVTDNEVEQEKMTPFAKRALIGLVIVETLALAVVGGKKFFKA